MSLRQALGAAPPRPRLDPATAAVLWRSSGFSPRLWRACAAVGALLILQFLGLCVVFVIGYNGEFRTANALHLFGVILLAIAVLLAFTSALCGFWLLYAARALRKLESITKEKP